MTLIAAFRCVEGVVLCADSQETVDIPDGRQYRVQVEKIRPQDAGEYQVVIGGSGDGPLVDGFTDAFVEHVAQWQPGLAGPAIKTKIRTLLHDYHRNEVALSAAFEDDKHLSFIVCIKQRGGSDVFLCKSVGPTVRDITDLTLLGDEEAMYLREAKRLYQPDIPSSEAILLGIHLFSIAKETSNVISGDTRIIVARDSGMYMLDSNEVKELEQRVKLFTEMSDAILLALPDITISSVELREYLDGFKTIAITLHEQFMIHVNHLRAERLRALPHPLDMNSPEVARWVDDPYTQLPTLEGLMRTMAEDSAMVKRLMEELSDEPLPGPITFEQLTADIEQAIKTLTIAAKLGRALYQAGGCGTVETPEAIQRWEQINNGIHKINEELWRFGEFVKTIQQPQRSDSQESEEAE